MIKARNTKLSQITKETAELEKAKKDTKYFVRFKDYLKQREKKEKAKKIQANL
ncbi:MAG: hypothetical protein K8I03_04805 [Ignavibacteria bacterium]|nr:hypothetical protein [Ignavibacteria bacterium]